MKLFELRKSLKQEFNQLEIDAVDVDFICAEVLQVSRTELPLIEDIDENAYKTIMECVEKRKNNVPVDKIFKRSYFYGLEFKINNYVLAPRQDSEAIVETALKYIKEFNYKSALDLCTGSGCLAVSIRKNVDIEMTASDISSRALAVAKQNAQKHNVEINFVKSDMFEGIAEKFDIIVSNPPYIATEELADLDKEVTLNDPRIALDGGELGLKFYNIIHDNLRKFLNDNGIVVMEIGEGQKPLIESLFNDFNLIETVLDYNGIERVLVFKK